MFDLFKILYITPFYFPNGQSSPKNKYYIPIYIDKDEIVFAFLPTRTIKVPKEKATHGCLNISNQNYSCYIFKKDIEVTDCGFYFDFDTCVYSYQLNEFSKQMLSEIYKVEDVDFEVIGELKKSEKIELLNCFINSRYIKRKIKKALILELANFS
ncbi:hypothetical protein GCM10022393_41740 [Aquimarina addita]|uniref:Uncharacterized protein n=1 Tax=Aquimarina addita TaxID=870485 RepID=A0ABP6UUF0_9FLAO